MARRRISALLNRMSSEIIREVDSELFACGEEVAVEAQINITTGAVSGANHVPSEPGQPPNNDTGHLADNIEVNQVMRHVVAVSSNASYSSDLEFGTSKMAARPFMAPAANAKRRTINKRMDRAMKRAVRRAREVS